MAPKTLVESNVESGRKLLEKLDSEGVPVDAALWVYSPELEQYKLVIGSERVAAQGPRAVYAKVREALHTLPPEDRIPLADIAVTSMAESVITTVSKAVQIGPGVKPRRLTNEVIDRVPIDDVYVYRMNVPQQSVSHAIAGDGDGCG